MVLDTEKKNMKEIIPTRVFFYSSATLILASITENDASSQRPLLAQCGRVNKVEGPL